MKHIFRKGLVCSIIVLFIGLSVVPIISGTIKKSNITSPIGGGDPDILWEVEGHTRSVYGVAFSYDGLTVASGAFDPDNTAKMRMEYYLLTFQVIINSLQQVILLTVIRQVEK
jgi:hypothetical protein